MDGSPATDVTRGHSLLWLGCILGVGFVLRATRMGDRSYWYDEGFSSKAITFPWPEMVERVGRDTAPPLHYLLLKAWALVFGNSAMALRSLSVLLGELTIVGMYLFTREAFGENGRGGTTDDARSNRDRATGMGLLVAALVAVSVFHIRWSCEARMYTLGTSLAAFSSWLLLRAVRAPRQRLGRWLAYAATALLFAYTQYYALFSIAAQLLFVLGYIAVRARWQPAAMLRDDRLWFSLLALGLLVVGWLPWLPVFLGQKHQVHENFWLSSIDWRTVANGWYQMFARSEDEIPSEEVALITANLYVVTSLALLWCAKSGEWLVFLSAWLPFALSIGISTYDTPVFHTHYFIFAHLFFLTMIAVLVHRIRPTAARRAATVAVLLGFLWVYRDYAAVGANRAEKPGARGAAAFLDSLRRPGEQVVVCSAMLTPTMEGHSRSREGWRTFVWGEYPHFQGTAVIRPGEYITLEELEGLRDARVWVIDTDRWNMGTYTIPMPSNWVRARQWSFPEIYGDGCKILVCEYVKDASIGVR